MSTIICRACGKTAKVQGQFAVCKNLHCDNWNKFATVGSDFFHENYMEEQ